MHSKLFIITGISGSGKTTVARQLISRGEVAFDSKVTAGLYQFVDASGNVAPSVHLQDAAWRQKYKWSLNEAKLDELLAQYDGAPRVFLCGRANLFQYWHKANKVLLLKVDAATLHQRLNSVTRDNLFAKDHTTQQKLLGELDAVQQKIIGKGAVPIDATRPVDEVVDHILEITKQP